jgi:type 2 lantibiotic biosynthesis protein LanM
MDAFFERLIVRAATIDELLSGAFEPLAGQKDDAELAGRRLAAWCRACASGDWALFSRRLARDGLSITAVLERFATVRRNAAAAPPAWIDDAIWIEAALQRQTQHAETLAAAEPSEPYPFEQLFTPVVEQADALVWSGLEARVSGNLDAAARAELRRSLLKELSGLCTAALYERFVKLRKAAQASPDAPPPQQRPGTSRYDEFIAEMTAGGLRRLFEDKPVLLRLLAVMTRQWIERSREFAVRLDADLTAIRRELLPAGSASRVARIEGNFSDPHNGGRSVQIVGFEDGSRIVYKPKDLRLDVAWRDLVERLNRDDPPLALKAVRAIARDGYGWTEFIAHTGCADQDGCKRYFRRAGAWLALLHCFAANDMHQENVIAAGDHPVPIDLETILQAPAEENKSQDAEGQAFDAAMETVANSVMLVGFLPAYGRSADNNVFTIGGMTADMSGRTRLTWDNVNSDEMRPTKSKEAAASNPNLPHVNGRYAKFGDHIDDFASGFEDYAKFLLHRSAGAMPAALLDGFAGLAVRKIMRPTRFYFMLLQRLKNHRAMDDGVIWSAQADFIARLAEWDNDSDLAWPLQRAERSALVALNVPHFVSSSDGDEIRDAAGVAVRTKAASGMDHARTRIRSFDARDIAWQIEVIRENTNSVLQLAEPTASRPGVKTALAAVAAVAPTKEIFLAEADRIAAELADRAIRRGPGAAWIGFDWLGDAEVFQLVCLGPDMYNGVSGIAVFLAAHAAVTRSAASAELARAGVAYLRKNLKSWNAARMARALGLGGATGLGSVLYALTLMATLLHDDDLLADAQVAARLFTDELIAADKQLDVIGGSAGGILGLLRLYRDTRSGDVLDRAIKCGDHLLTQSRIGPQGRQSWVGQGFGAQALNGMSHGAAGFAYALASLAAVTGREDFAQAASECIAFEDSSYDAERQNWPDWRSGGAPGWLTQWCHGAPGIGLARMATTRLGAKFAKLDAKCLAADVRNALGGVERGWPAHVDTLCCGTLGSIEFLCEAGSALGREDLSELASRRLTAVLQAAAATGDYRWNSGKKRFNLGLFRGLAGVGYTLLRQTDRSLPNVLIWE